MKYGILWNVPGPNNRPEVIGVFDTEDAARRDLDAGVRAGNLTRAYCQIIEVKA